MTTNALHLQDVHCTLGDRKVLQGLTTDRIPGGEVIAVLGRNGVGKSTLLRCIGGFAACSAERIQLGDLDLRPLSAAQRSQVLRYLPQNAPAALHLTVHECLLVALHAANPSPSYESRKNLRDVAEEVGLTPLLDRYLDELSGGQKQLVWIAQALLHRPRCLLLDEPLTALDPNHQHHVLRLLRRLAHGKGLIVLVVLHDLNMALRYADRAIVLVDGRVVAQGAVAEALSPDTLARAFDVEARLEHCRSGTPFIVVDELLAS